MRKQPHKNTEKVVKTCEPCNGTGRIMGGGLQAICADCKGDGHTLVNKEEYYKHLKLKNRKEKDVSKLEETCPW